jgi:hypothetical protein
VSGPRDRAHVVGTAPGINKLAAEPDCPTGERHVCAARGLGDNTGVVVAVNKPREWFQTVTNLKFKFKFEKMKNSQKIAKNTSMNLMMSNFFKYSFI